MKLKMKPTHGGFIKKFILSAILVNLY